MSFHVLCFVGLFSLSNSYYWDMFFDFRSNISSHDFTIKPLYIVVIKFGFNLTASCLKYMICFKMLSFHSLYFQKTRRWQLIRQNGSIRIPHNLSLSPPPSYSSLFSLPVSSNWRFFNISMCCISNCELGIRGRDEQRTTIIRPIITVLMFVYPYLWNVRKVWQQSYEETSNMYVTWYL